MPNSSGLDCSYSALAFATQWISSIPNWSFNIVSWFHTSLASFNIIWLCFFLVIGIAGWCLLFEVGFSSLVFIGLLLWHFPHLRFDQLRSPLWLHCGIAIWRGNWVLNCDYSSDIAPWDMFYIISMAGLVDLVIYGSHVVICGSRY